MPGRGSLDWRGGVGGEERRTEECLIKSPCGVWTLRHYHTFPKFCKPFK